MMTVTGVQKSHFLRLVESSYGNLPESAEQGLLFLIDRMAEDEEIKSVKWAAYMLATVKHECANTFQPIEEYGKGKGRPYGKPVLATPSTPVSQNMGDVQHKYVSYYGRGYVQLTWKKNYESMGKALNLDLVFRPELALVPDFAYKIMSHGMVNGSFTGKKLADYISVSDVKTDYRSARKIINGLDKADLIKGYASSFEKMLRSSFDEWE
jgi:putative chitinase